jgi:hypothetical protein
MPDDTNAQLSSRRIAAGPVVLPFGMSVAPRSAEGFWEAATKPAQGHSPEPAVHALSAQPELEP